MMNVERGSDNNTSLTHTNTVLLGKDSVEVTEGSGEEIMSLDLGHLVDI